MSSILVVANVFHVEPSDQEKLVALLAEAARRVQSAPGFLGAALHRADDGRKVMMLARWSSREAYEAMRASAASGSSLEAIARLARFDPGFYEVVETYNPT